MGGKLIAVTEWVAGFVREGDRGIVVGREPAGEYGWKVGRMFRIRRVAARGTRVRRGGE